MDMIKCNLQYIKFIKNLKIYDKNIKKNFPRIKITNFYVLQTFTFYSRSRATFLWSLSSLGMRVASYWRQVLNNFLGVLCFSSTRLSPGNKNHTINVIHHSHTLNAFCLPTKETVQQPILYSSDLLLLISL